MVKIVSVAPHDSSVNLTVYRLQNQIFNEEGRIVTCLRFLNPLLRDALAEFPYSTPVNLVWKINIGFRGVQSQYECTLCNRCG